ncbi:hypothetical protein AGOR_G00187740 [Albula goreensis]|uniref:DUF4587 domain-containing protein n=1 Tax=Albula goreensis TaxID=1534307 RepID=A0A8T3CUG7_9TELE|nr:hypothetical protein AGOR_G00187740 [Albula goreensis]
MAWADDHYMQTQQLNEGSQHAQIIQQPALPLPTMILQQLPLAVSPVAPAIRPGHVKEDLTELMMIQNAQMHQVIMNNMTMTALCAFGYSQMPEAPEAVKYPMIMEDEEPEVYHHHYLPPLFPSYAPWAPPPQPHPHPALVYQGPVELHDPAPSSLRIRRAVPPPPPPSATRTVGADVPPAAEYYDATERRL